MAERSEFGIFYLHSKKPVEINLDWSVGVTPVIWSHELQRLPALLCSGYTREKAPVMWDSLLDLPSPSLSRTMGSGCPLAARRAQAGESGAPW